MKPGLFILLAIIALAGCGTMTKYEESSYKVLTASENIEVREYAPRLLAAVTIEGERDEAANKAFRILFDYISGKNAASQNVAMTVPVTQTKGEEIAMTVPVTQEQNACKWRLAFVMPAKYDMATLPKPADARIEIISEAPQKVAAIRFGGWANDTKLAKHEEKLREYIAANNLTPKGGAFYAFYNSPYAIFNRRNEVIIPLE